MDSLFFNRYYPPLRGYLNNSQLDKGEILLSLPLDGEGRTITSGQHTVAVEFPARTDSAVEAVYVFVHEAAGLASGQAVADNTTPTEKRTGVARGTRARQPCAPERCYCAAAFPISSPATSDSTSELRVGAQPRRISTVSSRARSRSRKR